MLNGRTAEATSSGSGSFRLRSVIGPVATAAAAGAGLLVVAFRDPSVAGSYPTCPFKALTGLDCPGCGSLRGTRALLEGNVLTSLDHNLLLLPGGLLAVWLWVAWFTRSATGRELPILRPTPLVSALLIGFVVTFAVARNLPGMTFLAS